MSDVTDLPLFGEPLAADLPPMSKRHQLKVKPTPRPIKVGPRVIVLSLAQDRRLIAGLVARFETTPCGPDRAAYFRARFLKPLVAKRVALGLAPEQQEVELDRVEQAMVLQILARQDRDGPGGRVA